VRFSARGGESEKPRPSGRMAEYSAGVRGLLAWSRALIQRSKLLKSRNPSPEGAAAQGTGVSRAGAGGRAHAQPMEVRSRSLPSQNRVNRAMRAENARLPLEEGRALRGRGVRENAGLAPPHNAGSLCLAPDQLVAADEALKSSPKGQRDHDLRPWPRPPLPPYRPNQATGASV
jgi:hypothetical protein